MGKFVDKFLGNFVANFVTNFPTKNLAKFVGKQISNEISNEQKFVGNFFVGNFCDKKFQFLLAICDEIFSSLNSLQNSLLIIRCKNCGKIRRR